MNTLVMRRALVGLAVVTSLAGCNAPASAVETGAAVPSAAQQQDAHPSDLQAGRLIEPTSFQALTSGADAIFVGRVEAVDSQFDYAYPTPIGEPAEAPSSVYLPWPSWHFIDYHVEVVDLLLPHGQLVSNKLATVRVANDFPEDLPIDDEFLFIVAWNVGEPPGSVYEVSGQPFGVVPMAGEEAVYWHGAPVRGYGADLSPNELVEALRAWLANQ